MVCVAKPLIRTIARLSLKGLFLHSLYPEKKGKAHPIGARWYAFPYNPFRGALAKRGARAHSEQLSPLLGFPSERVSKKSPLEEVLPCVRKERGSCPFWGKNPDKGLSYTYHRAPFLNGAEQNHRGGLGTTEVFTPRGARAPGLTFVCFCNLLGFLLFTSTLWVGKNPKACIPYPFGVG
jgi:hypothetical protein